MSTHGWQKVFKFTFIQQLKSKAFIVSSVLICTLILTMMILLGLLPTLAGGDDSSSGVTGDITVKKVYVIDNSGITKAEDYTDAFKSMNVEVVTASDEAQADTFSDTVKNGTACLLLTFEKEENYISIYAGRPADGSVSSEEANNISAMAESVFNYKRLQNYGLDENEISTALAPTSKNTSVIGEEVVNPIVEAIKSMVPMLSSLILFILIIVYGQLVAQSIALEKTSKVMELLLTSVRPLAVIIGKILAMGSLSLMQFMMFILSGALGGAVAVPMLMNHASSSLTPALPGGAVGGGAANEAGTDFINELMGYIGEALSGFNVISIIYIVIVFLIGFIFFALIAGLIGAGVNRSEDLNNAMQPFALIGVAGFYLAYFPSIFAPLEEGGQNIFMTLSYYLPISSPFALPSAMLTGNMNAVEGAISILILMVCTVLFALLVARVYEQVIMHTGNKLKLTDILGMAKNK